MLASIGSQDASTGFLPVCYLDVAVRFLGAIDAATADVDGNNAGCAVPWPEKLTGMPAVKELYTKDAYAYPLVASWIRYVHAKVARIGAYYDASEETGRDTTPPSENTIQRLRDPTKCGGAYFINNGVPYTRLHATAGDDEDENEATACHKIVRGGRGGDTWLQPSSIRPGCKHSLAPILKSQADTAVRKQGRTGALIMTCLECHNVLGYHLIETECTSRWLPLRRACNLRHHYCKRCGVIHSSHPLHKTSTAKLDILAVLTRYLVDPNVPNDEHADRVEIYYDFACGLAPVVLNRAPGLAQRVDFKHDR
jgi:hypothetical protein